LLGLLKKLGGMDISAIENDKTLDGAKDSIEDFEAWLLLRGSYYTEIAHYLRDEGG
jgi:hypothetical protein